MTAMTIKLQLSESALRTITVATATTVYGQVLIIAISPGADPGGGHGGQMTPPSACK